MFEKWKRELCYRKKGLFLLVVSSTLVASSVILSVVFVSLSSTPSIAINDVIYEVNDQGDLTIQVSGIIIGIAATNCNFGLQIPDTFEVDTLADGTPIIEMLSNGSALEITEDGNDYGLVFALRTYNTTVLPKNYLLEINSATLKVSASITPQWPQQEQTKQTGGSGAAVGDPYITSFYAYDSLKATDEYVKTWIYNPSNYYGILVKQLQYKLKCLDEVNPLDPHWEDWTPVYSRSTFVGERQTVEIHDYLDYIFTAPSNKKYALNHGDYRVTRVDASGTYPRGFWSDDHYPTTSQGEFEIEVQFGTHPVFVVHLYDNIFDSAEYVGSFGTTVSEWFNFIETWNIDYGGTTNLKTLFDIDFHSMIINWNPSESEIETLFNNKMKPFAGQALGLGGDWLEAVGTDEDNHGFDLLFATLGKRNTDCSSKVGKTAGHTNMGIAMGGYWVCFLGIPLWSIKNFHIDHTTLHEVLHTYNASAIPQSGYIMSASGDSNDMHTDTYNRIDRTRYGGDTASEGFEQGDPNSYGWTEVSGGYNFVQSTDHEVSGYYSGKHYGGSGSVYQMDKWVTKGTKPLHHVDCHLSGYVYSSHYNYYATSRIYLYYKDENNYVQFRFYDDYVTIFSKINSGAETYTTTSTESWHQKTWYFSLTLQDNAVSGYVYEVDGDDYYALNEHTYTGTLSSGGYIALKSRVGSYGSYYYDNLEFMKL